jgi:hypothetical protein
MCSATRSAHVDRGELARHIHTPAHVVTVPLHRSCAGCNGCASIGHTPRNDRFRSPKRKGEGTADNQKSSVRPAPCMHLSCCQSVNQVRAQLLRITSGSFGCRILHFFWPKQTKQGNAFVPIVMCHACASSKYYCTMRLRTY